MGIERNAAALLLKMRADGVHFGRLAMLGRQNLHLDFDEYLQFLRRVGRPPESALPEFAEGLLLALGATQVEAMDFSAYEGAALLHDMNQPVPPQWHQQYDVVFDGGTLEHVFNFPVAIRNCMELLKPGGRFVSATITNNWCGHGFYQFSPELFFRLFGPDNGFCIIEMYLANLRGRCYAVADPASIKSRVELCNGEPMFLLVHARRDAVCGIFSKTPQQSDYVANWSGGQSRPDGIFPKAWKNRPVIRQLRQLRQHLLNRRRFRKMSLANRQFFTPVELSI